MFYRPMWVFYKKSMNFYAIICATAALGGCSTGILDPKGPVGAGDSTILIDALLIMLVIAVPTILLGFWMAWRYRASNTKATYRPEWAYSGKIEAVVWSIPILTIMFIGGVIWIGCYALDPFKPLPSKAPTLEVQVISLDWKWLFIYPEQKIATVNQLVIPAGRPVHFSITSASVFNVFFIPQLGSMIYAMPGMVSQVHLQADRPATLWGQSTQFSGDGFSDMNFAVVAMTVDDFADWIRTARAHGPALDDKAYGELARQSTKVAPFTYSTVDPHLYGRIFVQQLPPGPGPSQDNPMPGIRPRPGS